MATQTQAAPSIAVADDQTFLTTAEAAAIIRTDQEYVSRQCANGNLVAKKLGKEWRIHREELDAFMRGHAKAPPARERARTGRKKAK